MPPKKAPASTPAPTEPVKPPQNDLPKFPTDSILSSSIPLQNQINRWIRDDNREWNLIWRGSESEFNIQDFHENCDGLGETVTLVRVRKAMSGEDDEPQDDPQQEEDEQTLAPVVPLTRSFHIFGGYLQQQWHSKNKFIRDPKAFIFALNDETPKEPEVQQEDPKAKGAKKPPAKGAPAPVAEDSIKELGKMWSPFVPEMAALGSSSRGPSFGKDLYIAQFSNQNKHSCATLGMVYGNDRIIEGDALRALAGDAHFVVDEIEVYASAVKEGSEAGSEQ